MIRILDDSSRIQLRSERDNTHCESICNEVDCVTDLLVSFDGWDYFTERNGTLENTEQLCKSSLHSLNYTNCIPLDRARRALHAGTLFAGILAAGKNWLRVLRNRVGGSSRMANIGRNSNTNHHVPVTSV